MTPLLTPVLWAGGAAWACSGAGAATQIARATWVGWLALGLGVVLAALITMMARARGLGRSHMVFAAWVVVVAHPAIWISARAGDCGRERLVGSGLFTLLLVGLVIWVRLRPGGSDQARHSG